MSAARALTLLLAVGALGGASDRPAPAGRIVAPPAATSRGALELPRFTLFGWVSPPVESTTFARYAELAGAGLNLALPALGDSGRLADNRARMDAAAASGVRCLTWDRRLLDADPARLDSIVADYRDHPGFFGWYLGDEPGPDSWDLVARLFAALRDRDPAHTPWNNLLGRGGFADRAAWESYLRAYLDRFRPAVLCADHYDFRKSGDAGLFVENAAGLNALAHERGIPFWAIVLLTGHGDLRVPTEGELRWQAAMLLAYGARGIGYFTYWTPPLDPQWNWQPAVIDTAGRRTPWYDALVRLNPRVRAAGETLATVQWLATTHSGSVPRGGTPFAPDGWVRGIAGRAALGHFADSLGTRHLLVANADSAGARTLTLALANAGRAWRLDPRGAWAPLAGLPLGGDLRVSLDLEPGDFALLRLDGRLDAAGGGGDGPRIEVSPDPAAGRARLAAERVGARGRLEILDGAGRRVWMRELPAGSTALDWGGERDSGGPAPAGVYFVRLEDARGVAVARLHWLGRR